MFATLAANALSFFKECKHCPGGDGGGVGGSFRQKDQRKGFFCSFSQPFYIRASMYCIPELWGVYSIPQSRQNAKLFLQSLESEPVFVNVYGAQESILRNRFRQPM
jgi:hypothetical protein